MTLVSVISSHQLRDHCQVRDLNSRPAELEDDDEARVVDHLRVLVAVLAVDALQEYERKGEDDADGPEDVPRFPAAEFPAQPVVVAAVREEPDEERRDAVGDLTDEQDDAGVHIVKLKNFVKVELKCMNIMLIKNAKYLLVKNRFEEFGLLDIKNITCWVTNL